eukprot:gnl/MRDRNA2_/MRDRNA2_137641_c0_seq1.p1 gnl/MRDRNA2_/MRDRNA2_137641_c0~~gnl/MRDRNA2_/MRDRNA2_137641_c0_seq1.p1  ORF type:complete len:575 (-),score=86.39 gnl/MRDRNA2_/MRDRNA2_137641_c0_seq1:32-1756(-)
MDMRGIDPYGRGSPDGSAAGAKRRILKEDSAVEALASTRKGRGRDSRRQRHLRQYVSISDAEAQGVGVPDVQSPSACASHNQWQPRLDQTHKGHQPHPPQPHPPETSPTSRGRGAQHHRMRTESTGESGDSHPNYPTTPCTYCCGNANAASSKSASKIRHGKEDVDRMLNRREDRENQFAAASSNPPSKRPPAQQYRAPGKAMEVRHAMQRSGLDASMKRHGSLSDDGATSGEPENVSVAAVVYHSRRPPARDQGCSSRESSLFETDTEPDSSLEPRWPRGGTPNNRHGQDSVGSSLGSSPATSKTLQNVKKPCYHSASSSRTLRKRTSLSDSEMPEHCLEGSDGDRVGGILRSRNKHRGSPDPRSGKRGSPGLGDEQKRVSFTDDSDANSGVDEFPAATAGALRQHNGNASKKNSSGIYRRPRPAKGDSARRASPIVQDEDNNSEPDGVFLMPRGLPNQGAIAMPKGKVPRPVSPERAFCDQKSQGERAFGARQPGDMEQSFIKFTEFAQKLEGVTMEGSTHQDEVSDLQDKYKELLALAMGLNEQKKMLEERLARPQDPELSPEEPERNPEC